MAGGTWSSQNKVRPGVYIRFRSKAAGGLTPGDRGVAAICKPLSWGPVGEMMEVEAGADMTPFTGYGITDGHNLFLREIFKGTDRTSGPRTVLLYRPAATGAAAAQAAIPGPAAREGDGAPSAGLQATARYPGARGNDISILSAEQTDGSFLVSTVVDGEIADQQRVTEADELSANAWVAFSGGPLAATAGITLSGGEDGTVQEAAYASFLTALEPHPFDALIYDGADAAVQAALLAFVQRMAEENGQYSQLVASGLTVPDSMFAINVQSGVTLSDGTVLTPEQATWWAGGAEAGARYNESLTYARYPGAVSVSPVLSSSGYTAALKAGQLVLSAGGGRVKVEQDINSLVTYTQDFGKAFRKNRVLRLCSTIANDIRRQFSDNFIGVADNNSDGRSRFKAGIVGYLLDIQANGGIQEFSAEDVEVLPGEEIDAVVVNLALKAVDAVEKIYLTVVVA